MRNAGLEEAQAGIKIAGRNINNLRYPDDTTLMAERETELKSLLKTWLKTQHKKRKIMASSPITSWQIDGEIMEPVQFSHSTMSNSLQPDVLQHTRLPYPSPTPGDFSNSSPLSQWCHPTISSSVACFCACLN